ncbi:MAG: hypothetical protein VCC00_02500 [Deltaproteobacteria bacterium]
MAKANAHAALRTELYDCCERVKRNELKTIEKGYLTFPVIKKLVCPTCNFVFKLRMFSRAELDEQLAGR